MSQLLSGVSRGGKQYRKNKLKLGGLNDGNGILEVLDEKGELSVLLNKLGITLGNGRVIVGGNGLLSTIVIQGNVKSYQFIGTTIFSAMGYSPTGWYENGTIGSVRDNLAFEFTIPKGFVVVRAYIVLEHMPLDYKLSSNTGYSRNLRLYKAGELQNGKLTLDDQFWHVGFSGLTFSEVSGAFGTYGFTGNSNGYSKIISNDIKESITTSTTDDATNILKIETANGLVTTQNALEQQSGACRATLNIIGYMPFEHN